MCAEETPLYNKQSCCPSHLLSLLEVVWSLRLEWEQHQYRDSWANNETRLGIQFSIVGYISAKATQLPCIITHLLQMVHIPFITLFRSSYCCNHILQIALHRVVSMKCHILARKWIGKGRNSQYKHEHALLRNRKSKWGNNLLSFRFLCENSRNITRNMRFHASIELCLDKYTMQQTQGKIMVLYTYSSSTVWNGDTCRTYFLILSILHHSFSISITSSSLQNADCHGKWSISVRKRTTGSSFWTSSIVI